MLAISTRRTGGIRCPRADHTDPITLQTDDPKPSPTRKGVSLAALRIGPFRAAEVRVPQHRLRNRDNMPAGALDRYHSQFRLRQLAVDLAVPPTLTLTLYDPNLDPIPSPIPCTK